MKLITKRDMIKDAIRSFRRSWGEGTYGADQRGRMAGAELGVLDSETVAADVVDEIIGNNSWTTMTCSECGYDADNIVRVGEEPDHGSATVNLCFACIEKLANTPWLMKKRGLE